MFIIKMGKISICLTHKIKNLLKCIFSISPTKEENPLGAIEIIIENKVIKSQYVKIDKYIEKYKTFEYVYDFGDYREHKIELERIVEDYKIGCPLLIAVVRQANLK